MWMMRKEKNPFGQTIIIIIVVQPFSPSIVHGIGSITYIRMKKDKNQINATADSSKYTCFVRMTADMKWKKQQKKARL